MNISVSYRNGGGQWKVWISENADRASAILSSDEFLARVRSWPAFDFTDKSSAQVADAISAQGIVAIVVGFFWNPLTKEIAAEVDGGGVKFNTAKQSYGAGSPGNVAHEVMHVLGFQHRGNLRTGNENTVPYRIGDWVDEIASARSHGECAP